VVRSSACYEDALTEAVEGGQAVGPSFNHLDLVGHSFRVAVGEWLVEVGEQFFAPESDAFGEGGEGRDRRSVDGGEEALEPLLGFDAAGRAVDRAEGFLETPRFRDQWLRLEQLAERAPLLEAEPFARLEQPVAGAEALLPPTAGARLSTTLTTTKRRLALALTANRL
jgi:hypothetical protein